jgi:hypothetical protein
LRQVANRNAKKIFSVAYLGKKKNICIKKPLFFSKMAEGTQKYEKIQVAEMQMGCVQPKPFEKNG